MKASDMLNCFGLHMRSKVQMIDGPVDFYAVTKYKGYIIWYNPFADNFAWNDFDRYTVHARLHECIDDIDVFIDVQFGRD